MKPGVKPLIDRLRNEVQGTDIDPEALIEIFTDWADQVIGKGFLSDRSETWYFLKQYAKDGE